MDRISESTRDVLKNINKIPGFNPGELMVPLDDGALFLNHQSRLRWFWLKYPDGKITTRKIEETESKIVCECLIYANRMDPEHAYIANETGECLTTEENDITPLGMAGVRARSSALGVACFNSHMADVYLDGETPVTETQKQEGTALPGTPKSEDPPKRGRKPKGAIQTAQPAASLKEEAKASEKAGMEGAVGTAGEDPTDGEPNQLTMENAAQSTQGNGESEPDNAEDAESAAARETPQPEKEPEEPEAPPEEPAAPESPADDNPAKDKEPVTVGTAATGNAPAKQGASAKPAPAAAPMPGWTMAAPGENDGQFVEKMDEAGAGMTAEEAMAIPCTAVGKSNPNYGKTLGVIAVENPGLIVWLATRFQGPDKKIINAAKLLMSKSSGELKLAS